MNLGRSVKAQEDSQLTDSKCILDEGLQKVTEKVGTLKLDKILADAAKDITQDLGHYLSWGRVSPLDREDQKSKKIRTEAYRSFEVLLKSQISEMLKKELQK